MRKSALVNSKKKDLNIQVKGTPQVEAPGPVTLRASLSPRGASQALMSCEMQFYAWVNSPPVDRAGPGWLFIWRSQRCAKLRVVADAGGCSLAHILIKHTSKARASQEYES